MCPLFSSMMKLSTEGQSYLEIPVEIRAGLLSMKRENSQYVVVMGKNSLLEFI